MPEEENLKTLYGQIIRLEVRKTSVDFKGDWKPINIHISGKKVGIEYGWTNNNLSSSLYGLENNSVDIEK